MSASPSRRRGARTATPCVSLTLPFTAVDRAVITRRPRGLIKVITSGEAARSGTPAAAAFSVRTSSVPGPAS